MDKSLIKINKNDTYTYSNIYVAGNQSRFQWNWAVYFLCINIIRPTSMEYLCVCFNASVVVKTVRLEKNLRYKSACLLIKLTDLFKKNNDEV